MTKRIFIPVECVNQIVDLLFDPKGAYIQVNFVDKEGNYTEVSLPYTEHSLRKCGYTGVVLR